MTVLALLMLLFPGSLDTQTILRDRAVKELRAERLECAQVLLSITHWLAPDAELAALEADAFRRLRAARSLARGAADLSAISDSPYRGLVARCTGETSKLRTGRNSSFTVTIDGERIVIRGRSVARKRIEPGEIESDRIVVVSDDETLAIEGRSLKVARKKPPGALAGRLLASEDPKEQSAGAMLYSVRSVVDALQRINDQRLASGLAPVGFSAELAHACGLHARYLAHTDSGMSQGLALHDEIEGSPWRTEEGARAARQSCISYYNLDCGVDQLMATLYHRVPLVAPGLARVGIAQTEKDFRYFSVIDVLSAHDDAAPRPVMVPGDGQTEVPVRFAVGESPDPRPTGSAAVVGYPITLSWYGEVDRDTTAVLETARGREVECWVSTPKEPANASRGDNAASLCLLPKKPLERATKHTVTVKAGEQTWSWSFTTK